MINGNVNEFVDYVNYGQELFFRCRGKKYFLQGWTEKGVNRLVLEIWDDEPYTGYAWQTSSDISMRECAKEFFEAKIFDGKTFWEVEKEIEWVDDDFTE